MKNAIKNYKTKFLPRTKENDIIKKKKQTFFI